MTGAEIALIFAAGVVTTFMVGVIALSVAYLALRAYRRDRERAGRDDLDTPKRREDLMDRAIRELIEQEKGDL